MEASQDSLDSFCPSCGGFKPLDEITGWCSDCISEHLPYTPNITAIIEQNSERWLSRFADMIEDVMIVGHSYYEARVIVREHTRPHCKKCGKAIRGSTEKAMFCVEHATLRARYDRAVKKGRTHEEALAWALS